MKLTAISLSCGRLGLCVASVSVDLDPTFLGSKNTAEAASRLKLVAERFEILRDGYYVNVRPGAEVLVRLLQTHLAHELQQLQQSFAAAALMVVIPSYPTTGSDEQASGIAINAAKAEAMDAALRQLDIPGSCIVRQSTRCISGAVKALFGQDTRALSAGKWERRLQLERDAVELFLQDGKRGSATEDVLQQFRVQDGRRNADARHDLSVVFWLAAAALMQRAEHLRLQHKGQQSQAKRQQAAQKQRKAAETHQKALEKWMRQQQQASQKRRSMGGRGRPGDTVLAFPALPVAAVADATSYCAAEEKLDLTGLGAAASHLTAAVKPEAVDLTQPGSPAAAGWAAAAAAAEAPGAPRKRRRMVDVKSDPECIILDD